MKKHLFSLLATFLALAFTFVSCGGGGGENNTPTTIAVTGCGVLPALIHDRIGAGMG